MSFLAAFHDAIKSALPHMLERVKDSGWHVRLAAATTIGKLAEDGMDWC
jgi:hypothetical protein